MYRVTMGHRIPSNLPVLIVGAGVSGLALAHGLRLRSIPFRLFERHAKSNLSQGHRFRISGDGLTALRSILSSQTQDLFARTAAEKAPFQPRYVDATRLRFEEPTTVEHPESMPIDRSWLRMLMARGIEDAIEYDKEFLSYEANTTRVKVTFRDGSQACGSVLVGADGIGSRVRRQLQPHRNLLDLERWILWGRTPLTDKLKERIPRDILTWFMAIDSDANAQAVIEPMLWTKSTEQESGRELPDFQDYLYWAVATEAAPRRPETIEGRKDFLEKVTQSWDPSLKLVFESAPHELSACVPILSSKPDLEMKSSERTGMVTIVGDSSNPMSPMGGSGGDVALQNVADLLSTIDQFGFTEDAIRRFEEAMELRAKPKIERSFQNGKKFWRGKEWHEYKAATAE